MENNTQQKQEYKAPQLQEWGTVANLTLTGEGEEDGFGGSIPGEGEED